MISKIILELVLSIHLIFLPVLAVTPGLYFISPTSGDTLQGIVEVKGSLPEDKFSSAELAYAFEGAAEPTWFLIQRFDQPIQDGLLAMWDTTTITDGSYRLRLVVHQTSGALVETSLERILVSNYSQSELASTAQGPLQIASTTVPQPGAQEASALPTRFVPNPASINNDELNMSVGSGVALAFISLGMLMIYVIFRGISRR